MPQILLDGLAFPESPRWHEGALWFSEKRAGRVVRVGLDGSATTVLEVPGGPSGLGWLPDGRLVVVSMNDRRVLRLDPDGLTTAADLSGVIADRPNDMVVDGTGRAYIGHFGYDVLGGGAPKPASLILVTPDGKVRVVAENFDVPNGSVVTPDDRVLIVAESLGRRLTAFDVDADGSLSGRRVFADLGDVTPDGICLDAEGAVWVADPLGGAAVRVREGGEVTDRIPTGDGGAFACELGGEDGRTLFVCTYTAEASMRADAPPIGSIEVVRVNVPGATVA